MSEQCPFCGYEHENIGDMYGCPNCLGDGLEDDEENNCINP